MDMLEGTENPHCYGTAIATIALLIKIRGEGGRVISPKWLIEQIA